MNKTLVVDFDETLAKTLDSLQDFYKSLYPGAVLDPLQYTYEWDVWKDKQEHDEFWHQWAASDRYDAIPPLDQAVETMQTLKRQGYSLYVLTCPPNAPDIIRRRRDSVLNTFGADTFEDVLFGDGWMASKSDILKKLNPLALIDDVIGFIGEADALGIKTIMMNRLGRPVVGVPTASVIVRDWSAAYDQIIKWSPPC